MVLALANPYGWAYPVLPRVGPAEEAKVPFPRGGDVWKSEPPQHHDRQLPTTKPLGDVLYSPPPIYDPIEETL